MLRFGRVATKSAQFAYKQSAWRGLATYKTETGLAGVPVDPEGRENLIKYSKKVLENVKKIEPCDYRTQVEQWYSFILKTCEAKADIKAIEDEIGLGQIEEVIKIAKNEMGLIEYNYDEKIWERVERARRTADEMIEKMADSIFFTNPDHPDNPRNRAKAAAAAAAEAAAAAKK